MFLKNYDIVFSIESLCHSLDKGKLLKNIYDLLRPGGELIVIDGWRANNFSELPQIAQEGSRLVEQSMSVTEGMTFTEWLGTSESIGFELKEEEDLTDKIMPNLLRFQGMAERYFKRIRLAKFIKTIAPDLLIKNSIAAMLMPDVVKAGAHKYRFVVLKKPLV